jgi:hypothetical protein
VWYFLTKQRSDDRLTTEIRSTAAYAAELLYSASAGDPHRLWV